MGELGQSEDRSEGLAQTPRDPGSDVVKPQEPPLNRPGTEAEERAGKPGLDEGTTEGVSTTS